MKKLFLLLSVGIFLSGCAGIKYSHVSPEAENFHPETIAVLPVMIGDYQSAAGTVDNVVSQLLVDTGWFVNVIDAIALKNRLSASESLSRDLTEYLQKLNILGISDKNLAGKIADALRVDSFFLTSVTSWGYGRMEGNKVGRVGLGVKFICGNSGLVMWKANHEEVEDYWVIKPDLEKLSSEVMKRLLKEMPHSSTVENFDNDNVSESGKTENMPIE